MKPKIRIKFLNKDLVTIKDRLTDQTIEFTQGPVEKHTGPIQLEVTLMNKQDITSLFTYMERLAGDLPVLQKKTYTKKGESTSVMEEEPLKELVHEIKTKCKTQDEVIKFLRERHFVFLSHEFIKDFKLPIPIKDKHSDYSFMVRKIKEAKDPKNDKYDPQLAIGIKLDKSKELTVIYLYDESSIHKLPWAKKSDINFKSIKPMRFPVYMTEEERNRYRVEKAKYTNNTELPKSKFFLRWSPVVEDYNSKEA